MTAMIETGPQLLGQDVGSETGDAVTLRSGD
jgi:hypothetical protein